MFIRENLFLNFCYSLHGTSFHLEGTSSHVLVFARAWEELWKLRELIHALIFSRVLEGGGVAFAIERN